MKLFKILVISLLFSNQAYAELTLEVGNWDYPPFIVTDNQDPKGIFAEVLKTACFNTHVNCKTSTYSIKGMTAMGIAKELDILYALNKNEERSIWTDWSPAIVNSSADIFVLKTNPLNYAKPSDLENYTIGALMGSNFYKMLKEAIMDIKGAKAEGSDTIKIALDKLAGGRYANQGTTGAVMTNKDVGADLIKREGMTSLFRDAGVFESTPYYFCIVKDSKNKEARELVSAEIKRLMSDPAYVETLRAKYHFDIPLAK